MGGFRRVLCATDLSEAAEVAIRAADREARLHGAELAILHVLPVSQSGSPMSPEEVEKTLLRQESLASQIIDRLLERVEALTGRDAGQVTVMVEDGAPDEEIARQCETFGADLMVVGSHGQTGHRPRLFGSTAERVVKRSPVSVLVARPSYETGRILLATDFATSADAAAHLAANEAVRRCASITAVHSVEVIAPELALADMATIPPIALASYPVEEIRQAARKRLSETLAALGVDGDVEVTEGPPGEAIVKLAAERRAELVVIGSSHRSGIDRLLLGSVALRVVREAPCSVLVARVPPQPAHKTAPREQPLAAV
jgi:universal stress protein E